MQAVDRAYQQHCADNEDGIISTPGERYFKAGAAWADKQNEDLRSIAAALLEYIDAIPKGLQFEKSMPGIDREWAESVIQGLST